MAKKSLFQSLFGDKEADEIFDKLDKFNASFFKDIATSSTSRVDDISLDALGAFDSAENSVNPNGQKPTSKFDVAGIEDFIKGMTISKYRLSRYESYDTIYESLQLVKRIINVYIANIFQRDTINNTIFTIRNIEKVSKEKSEEYKKFTLQVIEYFKLEERLISNVGFKLLKYGDAFVEVMNVENMPYLTSKLPKVNTTFKSTMGQSARFKETAPNNNNNATLQFSNRTNINQNTLVVLENKFADKEVSDTAGREQIAIDYLSELIVVVDETDKGFTNIPDFELNLINESTDKEDNINAYYTKLKNIFLNFHNSRSIEVIVSPYGNVLGFLHIEQINVNNSGIVQTIAGATNARSVNNPNRSLHTYLQSTNSDTENTSINNPEVIDKLVLKLIHNVLNKFGVNFDSTMSQNDYVTHIKNTIGDDLYAKILRLIAEVSPNGKKLKPNEKIKVRLIPTQKMYWFSVPGSNVEPYGRSIIDPLVFPGKLYIFNQLSNMVMKMTRAPLIRKWTTDVGSRLDADNVVNKLKRQFKNSRLTAGDVIGSKTIANMLSNYRDLVVVQKNGKAHLDVEIADLGNSNIHVDDLEDNRREIIALSAIPPSHLGFPEPLELKESLVQSSTMMANEISIIQNVINTVITSFIDNIAKEVEFNTTFDDEEESNLNYDDDSANQPKPSDYVKISLFPPIVLTLQLIESSTTSIMNLINTLSSVKTLKIDPITLLQKYVPYIDWVALQHEGKVSDIETQLKEGPPPPDGMM